MADQVQVAKTNAYLAYGLPSDNAAKAPKINAYFILEPGEGDSGEDATTNGGVFMNIVTKRV